MFNRILGKFGSQLTMLRYNENIFSYVTDKSFLRTCFFMKYNVMKLRN